ncbi:DUF58 domain-containing protein [Sneathiella sp. P13V-1]|uniref:DUF58 domain-containing protein n=1 Tax=Sneathiella sp. P13V-1 TaxID=2697366 RepID=UPI00187B6A92|nr:DUF58 domain-containing protein [Sneathiella sp. P13V-1]MBE7635534.1 DUF58 domain-containing protein [Sneathiella sp. P13V-1]
MKSIQDHYRKVNESRAAADELVAGLPALTLSAEKLSRMIINGPHGRRRSGEGQDFWQFRPYEAGEEAQQIDWRQSAKRQSPHIRQSEQQTSDAMYFWLDRSRGMSYRSDREIRSKEEYGLLLILSLAILLDRGEEDYTLISGELSLSHGQLHLDHFARALVERRKSSYALNKNATKRTTGHVLMVSDFLMNEEHLEDLVEEFSSIGRRGIFLHLADPAEITLPFEGRIKFSHYQDEDTVTIEKVSEVREAYQSRFKSHCKNIQKLAQKIGWTYLFADTSEPAVDILAELMHQVGGR